LTPES